MKTFSHLKNLASESVVYGLSGIATKFLFVFLVPLYARIFAPSEYGVMSLVSNTMTLISIFVVLGLDSAVGRWFYDTEDDRDRRTTISTWSWCQFSVSVGFSIALFISSDYVANVIVGNASSSSYFKITALVLPLSTLGTVVTSWLRLQRRAWAMVGYSIGTNVFLVVLTVVFVVPLHLGLRGVYLAQLITAVISTGLVLVLMRGWLNFGLFEMRRLKEMLRYSLPLVPAGLAYWAVNLSGLYFIQGYATTSDVGLYQVGSSVASAMMLLTAAFQQAWGPFAMSIHRNEQAPRVYADVLTAYLMVTCFFAVLLSLFASQIVSLVATREYEGAGRVVAILSFNHVMIGLSYIAAVGASIAKSTKAYGIATVVAGVLTVALNFILVPLKGKEGAALSALIGQSVVPVVVFYSSQKLFPIPYRFGAAAGMIGLAGVVSFAGGSLPSFGAGEILLKIALVVILIAGIFTFKITSLGKIQALLIEIRSAVKT